MTIFSINCINLRNDLNIDIMRRVVMVVCAALLCVPLYIKSRPSQILSARPVFRALSSGRMLIKVSGAVQYQGIYEVPVNVLAEAVIKLASPIKPLEQITIKTAATVPLFNGQAVNLASLPDGTYHVIVDRMTVPECMILGIPLDISTMSEADFDRLPGIGPALAKRIVAYRQLNGGVLRFNDLTAIEGMGEKKLQLIQKLVQPAETNK